MERILTTELKMLESPAVPSKVSPDGLEEKWTRAWDENHTYTFDVNTDRKKVYSIDTPPPTVSGSLHVGHVFSYTHTDLMARYKRMQGYSVFYPMGWDRILCRHTMALASPSRCATRYPSRAATSSNCA